MLRGRHQYKLQEINLLGGMIKPVWVAAVFGNCSALWQIFGFASMWFCVDRYVFQWRLFVVFGVWA
jgi:hypothetical protein